MLAEAEKELGLAIPDEALAEMRANLEFTDEDFKVAADEVRSLRGLSLYPSIRIHYIEWIWAYKTSIARLLSAIGKRQFRLPDPSEIALDLDC